MTSNQLIDIFKPTKEQLEERHKKYLELHKRLAKEKGCSTCKDCADTGIRYPGFVEAEMFECLAGLECDTVHFKVKNCPKWMDSIGETE